MQDIPILSTDQPIVVLKVLRYLLEIPTQKIEGSSFQAGIVNKAQLKINSITAIQTTCSSNLCDKERIKE